MKDFAEIIGGQAGPGKSLEEIRATTQGKPVQKRNWQPPEGYQYGQKLSEWDSSLPAGAEDLLTRCEPRNDRILVKVLQNVHRSNTILLTDPEPLIGGCRQAIVLKTGPGRWIEGTWWWSKDGELIDGVQPYGWNWFPGYRRPVAVSPGQIVLIGNWVDLEAGGLALAQEGDVRSIWQN